MFKPVMLIRSWEVTPEVMRLLKTMQFYGGQKKMTARSAEALR